jgi:O-antigen/teichoic acid export membrane protein
LIVAYHRGAQLLAMALVPAAALLIFFGQPILWLWTSDAELSLLTAPVLALLAAGCLFNGLAHIPYMLQLGYGWSGFALRLNIVSAAIYVPTLLLVIPRYGALGAATCWLLLNLGSLVVSVQLMHRRLLGSEKWRWYVDDFLIPLAIAAVLVGGFALVTTHTLSANRLREMALVGGAAFTAMCGSALTRKLVRRLSESRPRTLVLSPNNDS